MEAPQPPPNQPEPLVAGFHFRGKLPHLKREGAIYFVKFRMADSLPAAVIAKLKHTREASLLSARSHPKAACSSEYSYVSP